MERASAVLRSAILLACLIVLAGCKVELYSNLSEQEANQIAATLIDAGISVDKEKLRDGVSILVAESEFANAVNLLNENGLPARRYQNMGEIFQKSGIVSSPTEEKARFVFALSQELENTIAEIDGVLSARVHVVLPEEDILGRQTEPSSASLFVRHVEGVPVEKLIPQIKMLVSNSIEGLVYERVSVVTVPAISLSKQVEREGAMVKSDMKPMDEGQSSLNFVTLTSRVLLLILIVGVAYFYRDFFLRGFNSILRLRRR